MRKRWVVRGGISLLFLLVTLYVLGWWMFPDGIDITVRSRQIAKPGEPLGRGVGTEKISLVLSGPEQIPVRAFIDPIEFTKHGFHLEWKSLATLKVVEPKREHPVSAFRGFLPHEAVTVGEIWAIEPEGVLQLLKQLAQKPQLKMHINPGSHGEAEGQWASLRAYNNHFAEIVFRLHAEFAFEDGFFTPSQFAGRLIIDRHSQELTHFDMRVPLSTLNFDVTREHADGHTGTDHGVCRIGMVAGEDVPKETTFLEKVSIEQSQLALAKQFYKSQEIAWVPLDKAMEMAKSLDRPIHVVSASGTFMDESC